MDYFFTTFLPILLNYVFAGLLVIGLILDMAQRSLKKKTIDYFLQINERRQKYVRIDSAIISYERKLLWSLPIWLLFTLFAYYFLPQFLFFSIEMILFFVLVLDDYFFRKSFLKAIDNK